MKIGPEIFNDGNPKMSLKEVQFQQHKTRLTYRPESTSDLQAIAEIWDNDVYRLTQLAELPFQTIIDIGANIGAFTVLAHYLWPDAHILAIEPEHDNYAVLQTNTNSLPNIRTAQYAVTDRPGEVWINPYYGNTQIAAQNDLSDTYGLAPSPWRDLAWSLAAAGHPIQQHVKSCTLNQTLDDLNPHGQIDLVKIDIEGAELEIFQTFHNWERIWYLTMECHSLDQPATGYYAQQIAATHDMLYLTDTDILAQRRR